MSYSYFRSFVSSSFFSFQKSTRGAYGACVAIIIYLFVLLLCSASSIWFYGRKLRPSMIGNLQSIVCHFRTLNTEAWSNRLASSNQTLIAQKLDFFTLVSNDHIPACRLHAIFLTSLPQWTLGFSFFPVDDFLMLARVYRTNDTSTHNGKCESIFFCRFYLFSLVARKVHLHISSVPMKGALMIILLSIPM